MLTVIIDYGSGNLRSAAKAFERAARDAGGGATITVTADAEVVRRADRIVLPGVGAFADCKDGLTELPGMIDTLQERVIGKGVPFLGICVGMQLLATVGHEHIESLGLGWVIGAVDPLKPNDPTLKVPHMGWNELEWPEGRRHALLAGLPDKSHAYFVHSYQLQPADPALIQATVDYGGPVVAMVGRDNIVGTQFHPEKSQATGLHLIGQFLRWRP